MIEAQKLVKAFGAFYALRGVDLSIPKGSTQCLLGPNGAGKSTFLQIIATLSKPTSGAVKIDGQSILKNADSVRKRIGLIAHATFLYDELTAFENLQFYAKLYDVADRDERISMLLDEVGLFPRRNDRVRTFSRGMQQRLSIARALIHDPDILYLDEPYTGLDQHGAEMLTGWLARFKSEHRTTVLVTHNISQALAVSDNIAIMTGGKIVMNAKTQALDSATFSAEYAEIVAGRKAA